MCTLTYIPQPGRSFMVTHNRDEAINRGKSSHMPEVRRLAGQNVIYPVDIQGGGTWIALSEGSMALCLLNGAFRQHKRQPPYRHSRGLVIPACIELGGVENFNNQYDLKNIEPFTLIVVSPGRLFEFRWDGSHKHLFKLNAELPFIWSSAQLYPSDIIRHREQVFKGWIKERKALSSADIIRFHRFTDEKNPAGSILIKKGAMLKTVSLTHIKVAGDNSSLHYFDFLSGSNSCLHLL